MNIINLFFINITYVYKQKVIFSSILSCVLVDKKYINKDI